MNDIDGICMEDIGQTSEHADISFQFVEAL